MKFEAVTLVNSNNEKVKKEKETKKLKNRIKKLARKVGLSKWQLEKKLS